jgi:soluble epoxide hydrolase / lipid-phosphate phosphatase
VKDLGLTPNLTIEKVDAGHWCMLSKPKEVGEIFVKWLGDNF